LRLSIVIDEKEAMHTVTPLYGHVISSDLNSDRSLFAIMLFIISPPFVFNLTGVLLQDYEKQVKLLQCVATRHFHSISPAVCNSFLQLVS
jgi:hypothetical protein